MLTSEKFSAIIGILLILKGEKKLNDTVALISDKLYTFILIPLPIAGGLFFTVRTKLATFRLFREQLRAVMDKPTESGGVSSFQALTVSTALCLGGFGSVFWMWIIAITGSSSAFIESTPAQIYKKKGPDGSYGGPAYYIEAGLKNRPLAVIFAVLLIITYGFGFNMLCSYNLQSTFSAYSLYNAETSPWIIGFIIAAIVCYCLMGGGSHIIKITPFLVSFIGAAYIFVSKYALRALKDYEKHRKEGREPVFYAEDIDLPHKVDYWN